MTTEELSHTAHRGWYERQYGPREERLEILKEMAAEKQKKTIDYWIHQRLFSLSDPFVHEDKQWLTVGDGYGFDANYFFKKDLDVTASDISGAFLPLSKELGYIKDYSEENVEALSFSDNSFDYVFCKESYHHFPRPYLAVYEMIRVAREAVIIVEPMDPVSAMPALLGLRNILDRVNPKLLGKFWKNRYSYEAVGNYVFKLSEREMEKLAAGIGLPAVAFKGINNNYYNAQTANELADISSSAYRALRRKVRVHNLLSALTLMPHHVLGAVIFKREPGKEVKSRMAKDGFRYYSIPPNPYIKSDG